MITAHCKNYNNYFISKYKFNIFQSYGKWKSYYFPTLILIFWSSWSLYFNFTRIFINISNYKSRYKHSKNFERLSWKNSFWRIRPSGMVPLILYVPWMVHCIGNYAPMYQIGCIKKVAQKPQNITYINCFPCLEVS